MQSKSPFKFLDSYTKEDFEIFFGRNHEIEEIYTKIFQSDLLLIFGASGTGKSSLINCGLANKFQETDWLPVNVRRGLNINNSLRTHLEKIAITDVKKKEKEDDNSYITRLIQSIYLDYFKPVYLIFDQFEELFIFGDRKEWMAFIDVVRNLLDSDLHVKFIFAIRGEYLEYLSEFEDKVPDFFNNRIRIEKMTRTNAMQCIEGPCKSYDIKLDPDFTENLLHKLSPEKAEIELTYLQVFLDRIFKIATEEKEKDSVEFTNSILDRMGKIGDVLSEFLEEQIEEIQDSDKALSILKAFVTTEGTKRQISLEESIEFAYTLGVDIKFNEAELIVQELVKRRILKDKDEVGRYELRHDSLAEKIYLKITQYERELIEVRKFIDYAYEEHVKREFLLNESDLAYILPYEDRLHLKPEVIEFLLESKKIIQKKKRSRKQLFLIVSVIVVLLISSISLLIFSMNQTIKVKKLAELAQDESKEAMNQSIIAEQQRKIAEENANEAQSLAMEADEQRIIAESQKNQAIKAQNEADLQRKIAIEEQARAEEAFQKSRENQMELLKQKSIADEERNKAERLRMLSLAQSLGAKSIQLQDPQQKALLALQGYLFNNEFNGYPYQADIYSGLYRAKLNLIPDGFHSYSNQSGPIRSILAFGELIFTASSDGRIMQFNLLGDKMDPSLFAKIDQVINILTISRSGKSLAIGSSDGTIYVYETSSRELIKTFEGHQGGIWTLQFTSDDMGLVSSGYDKKTYFWDLSADNHKLLFNSESMINSISIHPEGQLLMAGSKNGDILSYILDDIISVLEEPSEKDDLEISDQPFHSINKITFNHKGNILAIGTEVGYIAIWDFDKGGIFETLSGHTAMITDLNFSRDDKFLISSSMDGTAKLWNLDHSNEIPIVFDDHNAWVLSACFTSDDKYIITGDADGMIKVYPVEMDKLAADFCKYLNRNLNVDEWNKFIGEDIPYRNTCESIARER